MNFQKLINFPVDNPKIIHSAPFITISISYKNKLIFLKYKSTVACCVYNNSFYTLNSKNSVFIKSFFDLKYLLAAHFYSFYNCFNKLYMIGLGYKNFILDGKLYILIGDCNYLIFNIPSSLKLFCKKNQIYLLSSNCQELFDFAAVLKRIKKANFYKGKGVLEFKNFKFTKLKVGKKQRFA